MKWQVIKTYFCIFPFIHSICCRYKLNSNLANILKYTAFDSWLTNKPGKYSQLWMRIRTFRCLSPPSYPWISVKMVMWMWCRSDESRLPWANAILMIGNYAYFKKEKNRIPRTKESANNFKSAHLCWIHGCQYSATPLVQNYHNEQESIVFIMVFGESPRVQQWSCYILFLKYKPWAIRDGVRLLKPN